MKHRIKLRKLGRDSSHRWAMLRTMVDQLVRHGRIKTTEAKALELRRFADWVVTEGKKGDAPARLRASKLMRTNEAIDKVFNELAPLYQHRPGGFTRVKKIGWRQGDSANMAIIEFVDREGEVVPAKPVDEDTMERNKVKSSVSFRDLLPSRNWANDPHVYKFLSTKPNKAPKTTDQ
mmetsp:Transcript_22982/g.42939  ORF Transcript_22982/g.42939 Transcript_22982/m.42939 type:complete len:177 (-) Transcript_22982:93-623(-)